MEQHRLAFLTIENLTGFVCDDVLAVRALERHGWKVEFIPWRSRQDWDEFDLVVIRSTWDYHKDPDRFIETLRKINASKACLQNPISLVEWNLRKTYLRDLEGKGVPVVPTYWMSGVDPAGLAECFDTWRTSELVLKPVVGAAASRAHRLRRAEVRGRLEELRSIYPGDLVLVQPFMPWVVLEGEYSLFYFAGQLSHVVLKIPKSPDFRSQEEHGGLIGGLFQERVEPSLVKHADRAMAALALTPLYARVDLVRWEDRFLVMEFELIEPALYFRMDPGSPERFARGVDRLFEGVSKE